LVGDSIARLPSPPCCLLPSPSSLPVANDSTNVVGIPVDDHKDIAVADDRLL